MFVCAKGEKFEFAREIGVGLVGASIELTNLVLKELPESIIFIGSAGSYDKNIDLLEIFVGTQATQIESSFINGDSYTPIDNHIQCVSHETNKAKQATINSSNYITTSESIAKRMLQAGILLENMEFFSVLSVAKHFEIPCLGIFCVTNYCDSNAHSDFIIHHTQAESLLKDFVKCHFNHHSSDISNIIDK